MTAIQKIKYSTFSTQRIIQIPFPFLDLNRLLSEIFFLWVSLEMMVIEDPCGLLWCKHRFVGWIFTDGSTHCTSRWKHCYKGINIVNTAYICYIKFTRGSGSAVSIAAAYGLDGPEIESRWGRNFPHLSRPALRLTQPPVQWVAGLSQG